MTKWYIGKSGCCGLIISDEYNDAVTTFSISNNNKTSSVKVTQLLRVKLIMWLYRPLNSYKFFVDNIINMLNRMQMMEALQAN